MAMGQEKLVRVEVDAGKPVARHTRQVGEHSSELAHLVSQKLSRPLRLNLQMMECVHSGGTLII